MNTGSDSNDTSQPSGAAIRLQAQLLSCVRESVVATDLEGRILYWGRGAEDLYGYKAEEVVGKLYAQLAGPVRPEDGDAIRRNVLEHGSWRGEHVQRRRDGTEFWSSTIVSLVTDESGRPSGFIGIDADITDRRRTEQALRESEGRLRLFIEHAPASLAMFDRDMRYIAVSQRWRTDYNLGERDLIGRSHYDVFPEIGEELKAIHRRAMAGEVLRADEEPFDRADGSVQWLKWEARPWRDQAGAIGGIVIFSEDISKRKQAETLLRESEARLSNALKIARAGHWEYDVAGDTFTFNDNFYRIFRTTAAEVGGYTMRAAEYARRFCHPDDLPVVAAEIKKSNATQDPNYSRQLEHRILFADGTPGWIAVRFFVVQDARGRTVKTFGVNQDITEQKRAEEALREAQALLNDVGRIAKIGGWKMDLVTRKATWTLGTHEIAEIEPGQPIPGPDEHVDYYLPQYRPMIVEAMRALIEDDKPLEFEAELRSAKGTIKWCRAIGRAIRRAGKAVAVYGTFQDITELKKAEQALADELVRRRLLVEQSRDGIVVLDENGAVVEANRKYAEMLGYTPEETLNLHVWDWDAKEARERLLEMLRTVDAAGDHFETQHRRKDGSVFPVEISTNGATIGGRKLVFCVCRDITERRESEAKMKKQLAELRQWYSVTLEREERIIELKREVDQLLQRFGHEARYGVGG